MKKAKAVLKTGTSNCKEQALKKSTRKLCISNQVKFLGNLSRNALKKYLEQVQVVVSGSFKETFGLTLVEALALEKPVVSTASGSPCDFINENNGIFIKVNNHDEMVRALLEIRHRYSDFDPFQLRDSVVKSYGIQAFLTKTFQDLRLDGLN